MRHLYLFARLPSDKRLVETGLEELSPPRPTAPCHKRLALGTSLMVKNGADQEADQESSGGLRSSEL